MLPATILFGLLGLASPVAAKGNHEFFVDLAPVVQARMDPIVDPGKVSAHMHTVFGASNFRTVLNTPAEQQNAGCTTANIKGDNSNYWIPTLYFINKDGKYEPVQSRGARGYYDIADDNVQAFPQGLRMVTDTANSRNPYPVQVSGLQGGWYCEGGSGGAHLPNGTQPNNCKAFTSTLYYPSCGLASGQLDSDNHFDHMAFPVEIFGAPAVVRVNPRGPRCPASHPIHYPTVKLETYYELTDEQASQWRSAGNNFILSNGDTAGLSFPGDYVFGWDPQIFSDAITQCDDTSNEPWDCPPLKANPNNNSVYCVYQGMIPDESQGWDKALDRLPGCNEVWDETMGWNKPACKVAYKTPGWTYPNAMMMGNRAYSVPAAVNAGSTPVSQVPTYAGPAVSWFVAFDNLTSFAHVDTFYNGTNADVAANLDASSAANKSPGKMYGMKDDSVYSAMSPVKGPNVAQDTETFTGLAGGSNFTWNQVATDEPAQADWSTIFTQQAAAAATPTGAASPGTGTDPAAAGATGSATVSGTGTGTGAGAKESGTDAAAGADTATITGTAKGSIGGVFAPTGVSGTDTAAATDATGASGSGPAMAMPSGSDAMSAGTDAAVSAGTDAVSSGTGAPMSAATGADAAVPGTDTASPAATTTKRKCKPKMRRRSRIHGGHFE